jgi:hypothetical protein
MKQAAQHQLPSIHSTLLVLHAPAGSVEDGGVGDIGALVVGPDELALDGPRPLAREERQALALVRAALPVIDHHVVTCSNRIEMSSIHEMLSPIPGLFVS